MTDADSMRVHELAAVRRKRVHPAAPKNGSIRVVRVNPVLLQAALMLANGEAARLSISPDGEEITIANQPRKKNTP